MLTKNFGLGLVLAGFSLLLNGQSVRAVSLELIPSSTQINIGETVNIAVNISGLGNQTAPSLSFYDLDVSFSPTILSFNSATFGDPFLGDQLRLNGQSNTTDVVASAGLVNISENSGNSQTELDTLQAGSFTLARLSFTGISSGNSPLNLNVTEILDSLLDTLTVDSITGTSITVNSPANVPEPSISLGAFLLVMLTHYGLKKAR